MLKAVFEGRPQTINIPRNAMGALYKSMRDTGFLLEWSGMSLVEVTLSASPDFRRTGNRIAGIKAVRDAHNPKLSLRESKDFIEEVLSGSPKTLMLPREYADSLCKALKGSGFMVIVSSPEPLELSPHALRVIKALEGKPELLDEIRKALASR